MTEHLPRWIRIDPWSVKCPYCGDVTQYPDDVCYNCDKEVLPCKTKNAEG